VRARFSVPGQTGLEFHATSYTMSIGKFLRVKRAGCGVNHPHHLATRLKKEHSYTSTPLGLHGWLKGEFYLLPRLWNDLLHISLELLHFPPPSSPINFHPFPCSCQAMLFKGMLILQYV